MSWRMQQAGLVRVFWWGGEWGMRPSRHIPLVNCTALLYAGPRLDSVFLVFEYCPHDLGKLVDWLPKPFHESEVKCLIQQVVRVGG